MNYLTFIVHIGEILEKKNEALLVKFFKYLRYVFTKKTRHLVTETTKDRKNDEVAKHLAKQVGSKKTNHHYLL